MRKWMRSSGGWAWVRCRVSSQRREEREWECAGVLCMRCWRMSSGMLESAAIMILSRGMV